MSLGGVRDEAEIRGHRRTYIGSLPGKVLQNMARTASQPAVPVRRSRQDVDGLPRRPVVGAARSARPRAEHLVLDHYLEVDFDLSEVMFVCTANTLNIPAPLLDRMEVIRLPGYTEDEKQNIGAASCCRSRSSRTA
jgi:ATP-dependent Lon protease